MKFIKNIVKSLLRWTLSDISQTYASDSCQPVAANTMDADFGRGVGLTIYPAAGGKVIRFQNYDEKSDRMDRRLYIVTDSDNFAEELSAIITREMLSR